MGITVSDQEVRDVILSNDPPQFLRQNFVDSTGKFNKQLYLSAIYDPRNAKPLLQAEDYLRQNLLNQKLQSMLLASVSISQPEVKREFINQYTKINAQYALIDINQIPESTIKVTDEDMKSYYNDHMDKFQIKAQRKLKYVLFRNIATADDSSIVKNNLESILNETKSDTTSFESLVNTYSSVPYNKDTLSVNALPLGAVDKFDNAKPGSIIGPIAGPEGYVLYYFIGTVESNQPMVRASHILINQYGNDQQNLEEAMKVYNQLKSGADFATLAKQVSKDPGSARQGGDLGWFGKGQMVPAFDQAAFSGKVGEIQKPIKTNFGYHIIKVTGKSSKKYIVEKLVNPIVPSASTKDDNLNSAKDFSYLAKKDGFDKESQLMEYREQETTPFTKDSYGIPGIGANQNLMNFAFKNDLNTISDPFKTPQGYLVATVSDVIKEGVKPFDQVKSFLKSMVIREKKFKLALNEALMVKNKINGDLTKASSIDPKIVVNVTGSYTANTPAPTIGYEFNFINQSKSLPINTVSEPVKGSHGYFLIKVIDRTPFDSTAFANEANSIRQNLLQAKRNIFLSAWIANLKKDAKIVDNRQQFYQ